MIPRTRNIDLKGPLLRRAGREERRGGHGFAQVGIEVIFEVSISLSFPHRQRWQRIRIPIVWNIIGFVVNKT
jgi:hypothetical protein